MFRSPDMKSLKALAFLATMAGLSGPAAAQQTLEIPPEIMEAIQGDVATIHQELMQSTIVLQPGQTGAFWSIYDEYLEEVKTLTAERTELLKDFALAFDTMTDETATEMGRRAIAFDARRNDLVSRYFDRISSEVGGIVAGQFLQIETRIQTLKDLRLELEVPIIGG
jgi:hypothetical protein